MSQDKMIPHDELMALAGKWDSENGDYPESKQQCAADLRALLDSDAFRAMVRNDARYRWLRDSQNCSLSVSHNDHHNMYLPVADTMDDSQGYYDGVPDAERARMIETDTIWTVHVYPNTPVGFNVFHAATLDAAIDAAASGAGDS